MPAAQPRLSQRKPAWDNQRTALRAEADEAMANLAAAQLELDRRAETISAQEAQVSEQLVSIADLTDRADALALSVSDLSADLDTAQAEAVRLGEAMGSGAAGHTGSRRRVWNPGPPRTDPDGSAPAFRRAL